jgi:hypothetical protein
VYFEPDDDGFKIFIEQAFAITKRVSMFNLIRRTILKDGARVFE